MTDWTRHSRWTDPGLHAADVRNLNGGLPDLAATVQGLLVHLDWLALYGLSATDPTPESRQTFPLQTRLDRIRATSAAPLSAARPPRQRDQGTCRDFAVMLCGLLREHGTPARVRCGFASYFRPGRFEDHWICEVQRPAHGGWLRVDAQLDPLLCRHLDVGIDPLALPAASFLTAKEAWTAVRQGASAADAFGHGAAAGAWFIWINLARDALALAGRKTSAWDGWRAAAEHPPHPGTDARAACDALADAIGRLEAGGPVDDALLERPPFWSTADEAR